MKTLNIERYGLMNLNSDEINNTNGGIAIEAGLLVLTAIVGIGGAAITLGGAGVTILRLLKKRLS